MNLFNACDLFYKKWCRELEFRIASLEGIFVGVPNVDDLAVLNEDVFPFGPSKQILLVKLICLKFFGKWLAGHDYLAIVKAGLPLYPQRQAYPAG